MSRRANMFGAGQPGGTVEYRGDLTPPVTSYASTLPATPLASRLSVPSTTAATRSAVVVRAPRRNGNNFFYSHGAVQMPEALPAPGARGVGAVASSAFQRDNVQLMDWQINASWGAAGRPRNLGYSTRVPQLQTNVTGGPGKSSSTQRPLFTRVQTVQRAQAKVGRFKTRSSNA